MFSIYSRYFAYFAYSHKGELKFVKLVRKKIHDSATIPRNTLLYLIPLYIAAPASLSSRFLNNKVALVAPRTGHGSMLILCAKIGRTR